MSEILDALVRKIPEASREALAALAEAIEEFAAERVAAEREACAKIADDAAPTSMSPHATGGRMSCRQVAAAIRARSK
jgi:hypothetical protein